MHNPIETNLGNRIPLTRIQSTIAKRMLESNLTKPCFYVEANADVSILMELRPKLKKKFGVKVTTNAFYIRALAIAAEKYPIVLGELCGDTIKIPDHINIGFAVNAPTGLLVPVIKDANKKTLVEITRIEKELTDKARSNTLTLAEIEGQTIALSNLGAYGVDSFLGIVPPSVAVILAVANVNKQVISVNDNLQVRNMVSLSLAVDHRIINGAYAAQFLSFLKEQLQNPHEIV